MNFDEINFPEDIRSLNIQELEALCSEIRQYMITCCASNPGHLGSSLGAVEIACALHYCYNTPKDKLIWDVGHQAYAHKIITGRKEAFKNNRKYRGLSGFPKMSESEYDAFGTGHSSTSISAALGIATASKHLKDDSKVVAIIGDGALTGGMAFEALNNAGSQRANLLVILNDNNISIDNSTGALHNHLMRISSSRSYNSFKSRVWKAISSEKIRSWVQTFLKSSKIAIFNNGSLFESLGFRYFGTVDGHNIKQLVSTINRLKKLEGPILLHIVTKKGKGYTPAEKDQTTWHAPGVFDPSTGTRLNNDDPNMAKFQDVFGETILELAKKNERIVAITPAMVSGCGLSTMQRELPDRVYDVGIAESHAVTFSAGLAAAGMLPICNIYSSFMQRAYDNIIHDCALQKLKVIFCLDRAGIVGEDGATHHGYFDIACLRPIPNLCIAAPIDELELKNMLYSATLEHYPTIVIRYPRGYGLGSDWRNQDYTEIKIGKADLLNDGEGVAVLSLGSVGIKVSEAIKRVKEEKGINVLHYNMRFIKPIDKDALDYACSEASHIITVEDGTLSGGLYSAVAEYLSSKEKNVKLTGLGIPDEFIEQGTVNELIKECGYTTDDIYKTIISK